MGGRKILLVIGSGKHFYMFLILFFSIEQIRVSYVLLQDIIISVSRSFDFFLYVHIPYSCQCAVQEELHYVALPCSWDFLDVRIFKAFPIISCN